MLHQVIHNSDCAQCRLCCNFHRSSAWETPFLPEEQAEQWKKAGIPLTRRQQGGWSFLLQFTGDEAADCPRLDPHSGCRLPVENRPFECRIWPLRLMKENDRLLIGRYRNCPALQNGGDQKLDTLLFDSLLPSLLAFARKYPESVRPRAQEYIIVWEGNILDTIQ